MARTRRRAVLHLAEYCVLPVEVLALVKRDEELRPVIVWSSVSKRHLAARAELESLMKLVLEWPAVTRLAALQPS